MDGVIIDSNPYHKISWENFLVKTGYPYSDELFEKTISGQTGTTSLRILFGNELSEGEMDGYLEEIDGEFQKILAKADRVGSLPGLPDFLRAVKGAGHKTALATSAPTGNVDLTLDKINLREFFDLILDKSDVTNGKPDPEVYLKSVSRLGVKKDHCIVFEDSLAGIRAALNAGLKVIGVTTSHSRDVLLEQGVIMTIDDFQSFTPVDVIQLIDRTNNKRLE